MKQRRDSESNLYIYIRYIYCPPYNLFTLGHTCPAVNPMFPLVIVPLLPHNNHHMESQEMEEHKKYRKHIF